MRFYAGISFGPDELWVMIKIALIVLLVLTIAAYAAYRWVRGTVERIV